MSQKPDRDIEKSYPQHEFIAKLRRLADALEAGERFEIQIAGERIRVPARATLSIEHERGDATEEIEFQITWAPDENLSEDVSSETEPAMDPASR